MQAPQPAVMADSRWVYTVVYSDWRQGREEGTEETCRVERARA